ncbi:MAG: NlpC/P60 family protein [Fimbriimonadaceae bacterium]
MTCTMWACALLASGTYTPSNLHKIQNGESFATVSKMYGVGYEALASANPGMVPEKLMPGSVILVPARIEKPAEPMKPGTYRVENGDTDWSIARRIGLTPKELRKMNPGVNWVKLQVGTKLKVPVKEGAAKASASLILAKNQAPTATTTHTVRSGESDWIIARKYDMTVKQLRSLNPGTNWDAIQIGKSLRVSKPTKVQSNEIETKRAKIVASDVIVRTGAKKDSGRVAIVDRGRIGSVRDRIGDWYKLAFDGGTVGWVRGDLLAPVYASSVHEVERTTPRSGAGVASGPLVAQAPTRPRAGTVPRAYVPPRSNGSSVSRPSSGAPLRDVNAGSLIGTALANLGTRYVWGGTSRSGFDCSGLTSYVYKQHGKAIPRTAAAQANQGQTVSKGELKEGDLVFFRTTRGTRISHVGIYMGNGKFVHASSGSGKVITSSLNEGYYNRRYAGAKRVANVGSSGATANASSKEKASAKEPETYVIKDTVEEQIKADAKAKEQPGTKEKEQAEPPKSPNVPDATGR